MVVVGLKIHNLIESLKSTVYFRMLLTFLRYIGFSKVVALKTQLLLAVQLVLAAQTQLLLEIWRFLTLSAQLVLETHYIF